MSAPVAGAVWPYSLPWTGLAAPFYPQLAALHAATPPSSAIASPSISISPSSSLFPLSQDKHKRRERESAAARAVRVEQSKQRKREREQQRYQEQKKQTQQIKKEMMEKENEEMKKKCKRLEKENMELKEKLEDKLPPSLKTNGGAFSAAVNRAIVRLVQEGCVSMKKVPLVLLIVLQVVAEWKVTEQELPSRETVRNCLQTAGIIAKEHTSSLLHEAAQSSTTLAHDASMLQGAPLLAAVVTTPERRINLGVRRTANGTAQEQVKVLTAIFNDLDAADVLPGIDNVMSDRCATANKISRDLAEACGRDANDPTNRFTCVMHALSNTTARMEKVWTGAGAIETEEKEVRTDALRPQNACSPVSV